LRLNFEFNLECYSCDLGARLAAHFESRRVAAHPVTLGALNSRPVTLKLRDGFARMFAPYL